MPQLTQYLRYTIGEGAEEYNSSNVLIVDAINPMFTCIRGYQRFNSSDDAVSALGNLGAFSDGGIANITVSASGGGYNFEVRGYFIRS